MGAALDYLTTTFTISVESRIKLWKGYDFIISLNFKPFQLSGVPQAPGAPEPVDWSQSHADLVWTEPIHDGGSPITSYIVEKKDKYNGVGYTFYYSYLTAYAISFTGFA